MRALAVAILVVGCGRVAFDPVVTGDAGDGGGTDDGVVTACTPTYGTLPGANWFTVTIARIPNGWVLAGAPMNDTAVEMAVVADDNSIGPVITLSSSNQPTTVQKAAWLDGALTVIWTTKTPVDTVHGRFSIDGTALGQASLGAVTNLQATDGAGELVLEYVTGGTLVVASLDGAGTLSMPFNVTTATTLTSKSMHTASGYLALWMTSPPLQLHLTGLSPTGTPIVADRLLGPTAANTLLRWLGSSHLLAWGDGSSPAQIETLDGNLNVLTGPSPLLPSMSSSSGLNFGWNGTEIGVAHPNLTSYDLSFLTADTTGAQTSAPMIFGPGVTTQLNGPVVAGGPNRFAVVWTVGTSSAETRFAVICR